MLLLFVQEVSVYDRNKQGTRINIISTFMSVQKQQPSIPTKPALFPKAAAEITHSLIALPGQS